ncbi:type VI secretion system lipoprotein TssJ [Enterobacterales bacterium AW_CKDN230030176-1A_HGKHYDSX7]
MMRFLSTITLLVMVLGVTGCTTLDRMSQVALDPSLPIGPPGDHPTQVAFSLNASPTLNANPHSLEPSTAWERAVGSDPYAISLSASDPHDLPEVQTSLDCQQVQLPAIPSALSDDAPPALPAHVLSATGALGSYADTTVLLTLPRTAAVASEPVATPMAIKILQLRDDSLLRNSLYQPLDEDPAKTLRSSYVRGDDYLLRPGQFKFVPFAPLEPDTRFIAVIGDYRNQENATWRQVLRVPPRGHQIVLSVLVNDTQLLLKEEDR